MLRSFAIWIVCLSLAACAAKSTAPTPVQLNDSEHSMVSKMLGRGARDVTNLTDYGFIAPIISEQRYYWWEFPDKTIAVVLVAAPPKKSKTVVEFEISEPGVGIKGIQNWDALRNSRKLKSRSALRMK